MGIVWQEYPVSRELRAGQKKQTPCVLWFTGLSGAGKSTIASALDKALYGLDVHSYLLDGDNLRHGLNKDLGFSDADRKENVRRVAETSKLFVDAGLIVISATFSPFTADRLEAKRTVGDASFIEVFIDTSLSECEKRDPKGLYKKARNGEIKCFTGIDSSYEEPQSPDIHIHTDIMSIENSVNNIICFLKGKCFIKEDSIT